MAQQQPKYQQIAEDLHRQIDSGDLPRGSRLPTEKELEDNYGVSRNTVRDAIKRLVSQGLVETRLGQGTFVTLQVPPFVTTLSPDRLTGRGGGEGAMYHSGVSAENRRPFVTTPRVEVQTPSDLIAKRLRIGPGTQVVSRHEKRYIDDIPWSLQTSFYPMDFIIRGATRLLMAEDIADGAVSYLEESLDIRQVGYRDLITARLPDDNEQRFFGIGHDLTVFVIYRTAFDQDKKPMRLTVTVFPTDRNQFIVDFGDDLPAPQYDEEPGEDA